MKTSLILLFSLLFVVSGCAQPAERKVGDACESCDLMYDGMPDNISWKTTIASKDEPGERLVISGTIFKPDGKTPAKDVILYVYHTDAAGVYSPSANQQHARRHGHLRGWMKTDENGKYQFSTIRPASYPNSKVEQHIHPLIKEPGTSYYWIDSFVFEDDKFLTKEMRNSERNRGGSGVIKLTKNADGTWVGTRDIILGLNVPNY